MPTIGVYELRDINYTGPNPFSSSVVANSSAPGSSTFTIDAGNTAIQFDVSDGDSNLNDEDGSQELTNDLDINGDSYDDEDEIFVEYSYVVRPVGSSDPADNITIYVVVIEGDVVGILSDSKLQDGVTYDILSIDSNVPSVPYASLVLCFAAGTRIATEDGQVAVEALKRGDMVRTIDHGLQPIKWISKTSHRWSPDPDKQKPILFQQGSLGAGLPHHKLIVSPQHRMLIPSAKGDILGPAKSMTGLKGVRQLNGCRKIDYFHVMFERHEVVIAEGAPSESFYPGPWVMQCLSKAQRIAVAGVLVSWPLEKKSGEYKGARQFTNVKQTRSLFETRRRCWNGEEVVTAMGSASPQTVGKVLPETGQDFRFVKRVASERCASRKKRELVGRG